VRRGARRPWALWLALLATSGCQENAPRQIGVARVYASGFIATADGPRELVIRFDRQACLNRRNVEVRDASGLGALVIEEPFVGWGVRRYLVPSRTVTLRGGLKVSGLSVILPLVRGTTDVTRASSNVISGRLDWIIGHPSTNTADTTTTRVRVVGEFSATEPCDP
jgi:hypothetical protein